MTGNTQNNVTPSAPRAPVRPAAGAQPPPLPAAAVAPPPPRPASPAAAGGVPFTDMERRVLLQMAGQLPTLSRLRFVPLILILSALGGIGIYLYDRWAAAGAYTGSVEIISNEPSATVLIDGQVRGKGAQVRIDRIAPGTHEVAILASGRQGYLLNVNVQPAFTSRRQIEMSVLPSAPFPPLRLR